MDRKCSTRTRPTRDAIEKLNPTGRVRVNIADRDFENCIYPIAYVVKLEL